MSKLTAEEVIAALELSAAEKSKRLTSAVEETKAGTGGTKLGGMDLEHHPKSEEKQ